MQSCPQVPQFLASDCRLTQLAAQRSAVGGEQLSLHLEPLAVFEQSGVVPAQAVPHAPQFRASDKSVSQPSSGLDEQCAKPAEHADAGTKHVPRRHSIPAAPAATLASFVQSWPQTPQFRMSVGDPHVSWSTETSAPRLSDAPAASRVPVDEASPASSVGATGHVAVWAQSGSGRQPGPSARKIDASAKAIARRTIAKCDPDMESSLLRRVPSIGSAGARQQVSAMESAARSPSAKLRASCQQKSELAHNPGHRRPLNARAAPRYRAQNGASSRGSASNGSACTTALSR